MPWLNLSGLKSFTYVIPGTTLSAPVVSNVAICETLDEVDIGASYVAKHHIG